MDSPLNQPLLGVNAESSLVEKCELRVQGMTCGACVEVCKLLDPPHIELTSTGH